MIVTHDCERTARLRQDVRTARVDALAQTPHWPPHIAGPLFTRPAAVELRATLYLPRPWEPAWRRRLGSGKPPRANAGELACSMLALLRRGGQMSENGPPRELPASYPVPPVLIAPMNRVLRRAGGPFYLTPDGRMHKRYTPVPASRLSPQTQGRRDQLARAAVEAGLRAARTLGFQVPALR